MVGAFHQQRLCHAVQLEGGTEAHLQLFRDQHLRGSVSECRALREPSGQSGSLFGELAILDHGIGKADGERPLRRDLLPEQEQFTGAT